MAKRGWMVRAGRGGKFFDQFQEGKVAIGWNNLGDLNQYRSQEELREAYIAEYGNAKPPQTANAIAMLRKFRDELNVGDTAITYSSETRNYLIGKITGEYCFISLSDNEEGYANSHDVDWIKEISRDDLSTKTKNSLGSTLTLFSLKPETLEEIEFLVAGNVPKKTTTEEDLEDNEEVRTAVAEQSHELIKDMIQALSPEEMEELVAAVLRALGYKTKVSPKGPDRGVDVVASPDGLGLTTPRIKVEVKHRGGTIGAQQLRSFLGALRDGDTGLYLSTGGFTREARYEAERATVSVTLIDIDDLAELVVTNYENFDLEGRALISLVRVYWPAD